MPTSERKSLSLEVKDVQDSGEFTLYAAAFNNLDRQGDIILPGAFNNLDEFVKDGWIASNHANSDPPIGYPTEAVQDAVGLKVSGQFHSTDCAQEVRQVVKERLAAGKRVLCSIGYTVEDAGFETRNGETIRILKSISVYEASFVNLPANSRAEVVAVKSADKLVSLDDLKSLIDGVKKGRVLSASNHAKLSSYADSLDDHGKAACAMASDMKSFLAQHDPAKPDPEDSSSGEIPIADLQKALRLRAVRGRAVFSCP